MRLFIYFITLLSLNAFAEPRTELPPGLRPLRIVSVEQKVETDPSKTVVHFVTNRLLVKPLKGEEKWKALAPPKLLLEVGASPLVGYTVVKHDGSKDLANNASLEPYSIESFHPQYKVQVDFHEDRFPPYTNKVNDDGLAFLRNYWGRNVLIYVHGFNNDWPTAIRRAAQLKRDLRKKHKEDFAIVVFSWPSLGGGGIEGIAEYTDDESRYQKTLPSFATFLDAILLKEGTTQGRGKRWVLAHSMGNRVFLRGFAEFGRRKEASRAKIPSDLFTRIVLAAPDMEIAAFEEHTKYVFQFCDNPQPVMYFHAASNIAVNASELKHLDARAGVQPVVSDYLLTIDAKAAKSPWSELGHGYYASNDKMVSLIADYFFDAADPSQSPDIERVGGGRWRLK